MGLSSGYGPSSHRHRSASESTDYDYYYANGKQKDIDSVVTTSPDLVLLSLKTLGSLSPPEEALIMLAQKSVLPFLNASDMRVRQEAAITCAKLVLSLRRPFKTRGPTAEATEDIITVLLNTMVSDPESAVRLAVLRCLTSDFDVSSAVSFSFSYSHRLVTVLTSLFSSFLLLLLPTTTQTTRLYRHRDT